MFKLGDRCQFRYRSSGMPLPKYVEHSNAAVEVLRALTPEETGSDGEQMFKIRTTDGWLGFVFENELTLIPKEKVCR